MKLWYRGAIWLMMGFPDGETVDHQETRAKQVDVASENDIFIYRHAWIYHTWPTKQKPVMSVKDNSELTYYVGETS